MAHVVLAAALAVPVHAAVGIIAFSALTGVSIVEGWALAGILVAFFAGVAGVGLLPGVRQVEIATARVLLGLDLPDVQEASTWPSRWRGLLWLAILVVVGTLAAGALLYFIPLGVGLLAFPFTGLAEFTLPGQGPRLHVGSGWASSWLVLVGVACLGVCGAVFVAGGQLLRRWAPVVIGPTLLERVATAAQREGELARATTLAREVHDAVGHTLTAMTVQVAAARSLLHRDLQAADRALAAVEELGRQAQSDVDAVVGELRAAADPGHASGGPASRQARPDERVDAAPLVVEAAAAPGVTVRLSGALVLDSGEAHDLRRTVQEAVTNALRHGRRGADVEVRRDTDRVVLVVRNEVAAAAESVGPAPVRTGHGLVGLAERLSLRGGTLTAGTDEEGMWTLRAVLPVRT